MTRPRSLLAGADALELAVVALFFIGGSILALAFAVVYVGVNLINVMGATWHLILH